MPLHCGISEKWRPFAEAGVCDRRHTDENSNSLVPSGDRLRKPAFAIDGTQAKFSNDFSRARAHARARGQDRQGLAMRSNSRRCAATHVGQRVMLVRTKSLGIDHLDHVDKTARPFAPTREYNSRLSAVLLIRLAQLTNAPCKRLERNQRQKLRRPPRSGKIEICMPFGRWFPTPHQKQRLYIYLGTRPFRPLGIETDARCCCCQTYDRTQILR